MTTSTLSVWTTQRAFILAAVGSAVGLGNVWKFPYITGEYGGGAFVLVYLLCLLLIGLPVLMTEIALGRRGRRSPLNSLKSLAIAAGRNPHWKWIGGIGVLAALLILSYYSVVAGQVMAYVFRAASGAFADQTADGIEHIFTALSSDPERLLAWHTLFMLMTVAVVAQGVQKGLERAVNMLMPLLFVLLLMLVVYAMQTPGVDEAIAFLFGVDFDRLFYLRDVTGQYMLDAQGERVFTATPLMVAMGHAFFTLSLGMGALMMYGAYLNADASIARTSLQIVLLDTLVALMAGLAIFPLVFSHGLDPASGPSLIFQTLPIAFGSMASGQGVGLAFFLLLTIAAWTSAISLLEPIVCWMMERKQVSRIRAAIQSGLMIWSLGILSLFAATGVRLRDMAESLLSPFVELPEAFLNHSFMALSAYDLINFLTANIMLPLVGLGLAVFAGWVMTRSSIQDELALGQGFLYRLWEVVIRYISPTAIIVIFFYAVGVFAWFSR